MRTQSSARPARSTAAPTEPASTAATTRTVARRRRRTESPAAPASAPTPIVDAAAETRTITPEEIAREAYLIWLSRGGNDVVNWLEAERRLLRRAND